MIEYHFPLVQPILEVGFEFLEKNERTVENFEGGGKGGEWIDTSKPGTSFKRHNSSHDFLGSQVVGFTKGFSRLMPPVNRNIHWGVEIFPCLYSKFIKRRRENKSLSFSNNDRHMFT